MKDSLPQLLAVSWCIPPTLAPFGGLLSQKELPCSKWCSLLGVDHIQKLIGMKIERPGCLAPNSGQLWRAISSLESLQHPPSLPLRLHSNSPSLCVIWLLPLPFPRVDLKSIPEEPSSTHNCISASRRTQPVTKRTSQTYWNMDYSFVWNTCLPEKCSQNIDLGHMVNGGRTCNQKSCCGFQLVCWLAG